MLEEKEEKEFLSITDMLKKLGGISRSKFFRLRRKGYVPKPIIPDPPTWRLKDVDAFYDELSESQKTKGTTEVTTTLSQQ